MLDTIVRPDQGPATEPVGPPVALAGSEPVTLVPVLRGYARPIGAYVIARGNVHYRPAYDLREVLAAVAVVAAAVAFTRRRRPAIGAVHMGPGGWVSLKGVPAPALTADRPWWARLLRARRLVLETPTRTRRRRCARPS
ncbi:hypothetical protein RB614_05725 [Phytohabitans sp. ZYX-F-186]|uniref:Uncharacterized protein n=1 Tax=Phytohabitans maris TaxID=3071409 RepID=A0ABU0ZAD5_9ACTN|nr:hypothetical protein [Phytohabitans sp. ZYX-F-186]MDQ7904020.1 hypothetical protein [Phytohabitans sp. ZYX-F-186]